MTYGRRTPPHSVGVVYRILKGIESRDSRKTNRLHEKDPNDYSMTKLVLFMYPRLKMRNSDEIFKTVCLCSPYS